MKIDMSMVSYHPDGALMMIRSTDLDDSNLYAFKSYVKYASHPLRRDYTSIVKFRIRGTPHHD